MVDSSKTNYKLKTSIVRAPTNMRFAAVVVVVIALAAAIADAHSHRVGQAGARPVTAAAAAAAATLTKHNFSGVATFGQPGKFMWRRKFGYLDTRFKIPLPDSPSYPVASNTKVYVAISLYQLQERGRVKLTDNVADHITPADLLSFGLPASVTRYCPVVANSTACQTITFVQLLAMSAGLSDTFGPQFLPYPGSLAATLRPYMSAPLRFVPGTGYFYSNPSFILAAWFVEKFSGVDFQTYLKRNIFGPLGLTRTYWDPYNGKFNLDPNRVVEYYQFMDATNRSDLLATGVCSSEFDLGSSSGAGGIVSTQDDERKLYYALFNFTAGATNAVIGRQSLLELVTPRTRIHDGYYFGQGLFLVTAAANSSRPRQQRASPSPYLPPTTPVVTQVVYEGEIMCSHTSNVYDMTYAPPIMGQVWSSVIVYYPTKPAWVGVQQKRVGGFWDAVASWAAQPSLQSMCQSIIASFSS